ncbi:ABC transporter substrate-binding protein [Acuticoccus sediminis]|uniref:ABC transporter substrate-binding protein n=1 Tax=Acuticoccus sediminis TaxID=2184697 RepID=UPI001CFDAC85|nr:ABC transporter substrate-binding protein [Acuticoccus sediminis]
MSGSGMKRLSAPMVSRRGFLAGSGGIALGLSMPKWATAQGKSIVSCIFGGSFEDAYRKSIVEPFTAETGVEVTLKYGNGSEWLTNAVINRNNPEIDLLWLPYPQNIQAINEGLCIELTPEDIPNLTEIAAPWYDGFRKMGVGLDYASFGIGYRTDMVETEPTSWKDLWNEDYAGKITLPDITASGGYQLLVMAAIAHGGSIENIDPGFEALKELKPRVRKFYKSNPEATQLLERGEVAVAAWFDGRSWGLADKGVPMKWVAPSEGASAAMVSYHIPTNARDPEVCKAFINYAISKEAQEAFCNMMQYGPVNTTAVLTGQAAERVPPLSSLKQLDWFGIVPRIGEWQDRWNREITS